MARYSVAEAKNNLPKLIDRAMAGEEVTITRRGEPVVNLTPQKPQGIKLDMAWFDKHRVHPSNGAKIDATALIRQMRDEGF